MAKKDEKANDPQEEKLLTPKKTVTPEGASDIKNGLTELIPKDSIEKNQSLHLKMIETSEKIDYSSFNTTELISELENLLGKIIGIIRVKIFKNSLNNLKKILKMKLGKKRRFYERWW